MTETPNHSYNVPEQGDENWHEPLNENFQQYDTDIEIRDTDDAKTQYEPQDGAKYLATDTGIIYTGDGESWNAELVQARLTDDATEITLDAGNSLTIDGDIEVSGTKHFVETVTTDAGDREVLYTAREAPTPRTETSGVDSLTDGRAVIDLPDHFAWVTDETEPLLVQTTPYATDSAGLAVVSRSPEQIIVEDRDGTGDYEFAYTVSGTRVGEANREVVRPTELTADIQTPSEPDADD